MYCSFMQDTIPRLLDESGVCDLSDSVLTLIPLGTFMLYKLHCAVALMVSQWHVCFYIGKGNTILLHPEH